jgi:hypothetical protein
MKQVKIISNANHEALEVEATKAVNDPNFSEIHYNGHSVLVIYEVSDEKENSISPGRDQKTSLINSAAQIN